MRIKTEVWEIFALGMIVYLWKRKSTAQVKKLKKEKPAKRKMLTVEIGVYLLIEKINDAGKENLIKRKSTEREKLTAGIGVYLLKRRLTTRAKKA